MKYNLIILYNNYNKEYDYLIGFLVIYLTVQGNPCLR